ncbi:BspA family leucine-rich repeat surface protein, partial [uncultured Brachyspira sp.]
FNRAESFNQPLNNWNVSNVEDMSYMFNEAESFNQNINNWNISKLRDIDYIFNCALYFDKNNALEFYLKFCSNKNTQKAIKELDSIVSELDVKKFYKLALKYNKKSVSEIIKKLENTHYGELKELIDSKEEIIKEYKELEKSEKKSMPKKEKKDKNKIYQPKDKEELIKLIKDKIKFNKIDTSLITDMSGLFENSRLRKFDGIETWDTSNVVNMESMFEYAVYFNHNINNWNVSNVKNMKKMFLGAESFNQPLNNWNVSNVENMRNMFYVAKSFNQPLNNWDTSNVKNMIDMFEGAESFNQDLNSWNTNNLQYTSCMFRYSPMQDNLPSWYN